MTPEIEISIEYAPWESMEDLAAIVNAAIKVTVENCGKRVAKNTEVSLLLCDDAKIKSMNRDWRGIDKPTNVLSFPTRGQLAQKPMLGDIAIAFETTRAEALDESKSMRDHFSHLLVHGFLHLLAFDHETASEADEMEAMERLVLNKLGIADPYSGSVPLEGHSSR